MDELLLLIQKTYGIVGLLILAPLAAVFFVWKENVRITKQMQDMITTHTDKLSFAQMQRVQDAQQVGAALIKLVGEQSGLNKETNLALTSINTALDRLDRRS